MTTLALFEEQVNHRTENKPRISITKEGKKFVARLSAFNGQQQVVCGVRYCKTFQGAMRVAQNWMKFEPKNEWLKIG